MIQRSRRFDLEADSYIKDKVFEEEQYSLNTEKLVVAFYFIFTIEF